MANAVRSAIDYGISMERVNLSRQNLSRADLSYGDFREADLSYADLSQSDLTEADFRGATMVRTNFRRAGLYHANLSYSDISKCDFTGAAMIKTVLERSWLADSKFYEARMKASVLRDVRATRCDFTKAFLQRAVMDRIYLSHSKLDEANLNNAGISGIGLHNVTTRGAKYNGDTFTNGLVSISGLTYEVLATDTKVQIGCQVKTIPEWEAVVPAEVIKIGPHAVTFYRMYRDHLLGLFRARLDHNNTCKHPE